MPPSTRDIMDIVNSKYAVVVAIAKQARVLSEKNKGNENYRLSSMVSEALDELIKGDLKIYHSKDSKEVCHTQEEQNG